MKYTKKIVGNYKGKDVTEIKLLTSSGTYMTFWSLGARVNEFFLEGIGNIILSYKSLDQLLKNRSYFLGASVGRVGGRISGASFKLNDKLYKLDKNDGNNHLHGGDKGFDLRNWDFDLEEGADYIKLNFKLYDKEATNYYPGNLKAKISHTLTDTEKWTIDYWALADADTIYNPTNHVYFNLNANFNPVTNHYLRVDSSYILETDEDLIPTGQKINIKESSLDFSKAKLLKEALNSKDSEIVKNRGLDTAFILNKDEKIGINLRNDILSLDVITDRDSVIIYSLNKVNENSSIKLVKNQGLALETQSLPDAINQEYFGNVILREGEEFKSQTTYKIHRI